MSATKFEICDEAEFNALMKMEICLSEPEAIQEEITIKPKNKNQVIMNQERLEEEVLARYYQLSDKERQEVQARAYQVVERQQQEIEARKLQLSDKQEFEAMMEQPIDMTIPEKKQVEKNKTEASALIDDLITYSEIRAKEEK